jgi:signal transduction histidine kinase
MLSKRAQNSSQKTLNSLEHSKKLRIVVILSSAYILLAFGWWSILLLKKNEDAKQARTKLAQLEYMQNNPVFDETAFKQTPQYFEIERIYGRQKMMVWGEGGVSFIGLLLGIWLISRSFSQEIALSNQRKNFLLSITHELKSPIASIQLVLQTFQKRKLDEAQQAKLLHSATVETERLNILVNNLLLSARLDSTYEPQFEELRMTAIIEELVEKMRIKSPKAQFNVIKNHDLPILRGDKQGMVSVFSKLIENALKYSGERPNITIRQNFEKQNFIFDIADNGIGIPQTERKKVLEKFYRVGSELTRKTKGTGLGLYIVSEVVKLHKGTIQILDNAPQGTIFRITLPS